jgi:hypothetical protein
MKKNKNGYSTNGLTKIPGATIAAIYVPLKSRLSTWTHLVGTQSDEGREFLEDTDA